MTETKINSFLAVIQYGSFSRAAEALYISQPALSSQIQSLEQELNTKLLLRQSGIHGVRLTRAGENFVPLAEQWQKLFYQSQHLLEQNHLFEYRIATIQSLNTGIMPAVCRHFISSNPGCTLSVDVLYSADAYQAMDAQQCHCALITIPCSSGKLEAKPLFAEKMYLLASDRQWGQETIHPKQLKVENEIYLHWSTGFERWHHHWFGDKRPRITVSDMPTPEALLAGTDYWAIVPASIANRIPTSCGICRYTIEEGPADRIVYFLSPRSGIHRNIQAANRLLIKSIYNVMQEQCGISLIPMHAPRIFGNGPSPFQTEKREEED